MDRIEGATKLVIDDSEPEHVSAPRIKIVIVVFKAIDSHLNVRL